MRDIPTASTYCEPTVLWRMQRGERQSSHAVISPKADGARVLWFVNSHLLGMRDFDDWTEALTWCERIRDQNWAFGWRLVDDERAAAS